MFDFEFDKEDLISEDIDLQKVNIFPDNYRFKNMIALELDNESSKGLTLKKVRRTLELIFERNNLRASLFYYNGNDSRINSKEEIEIDYQKIRHYSFPKFKLLLCIEFNLSTKEIMRWLAFLRYVFDWNIVSFSFYYNQIKICSSHSINVENLRSNIKSILRGKYWVTSFDEKKYNEFCKFVDSIALFSEPHAYSKNELYERLDKKTRHIQSLKGNQRLAL